MILASCFFFYCFMLVFPMHLKSDLTVVNIVFVPELFVIIHFEGIHVWLFRVKIELRSVAHPAIQYWQPLKSDKGPGKVNPILQILELSTTRILPRLLFGWIYLVWPLSWTPQTGWCCWLPTWVHFFFPLQDADARVSVSDESPDPLERHWVLGHRNYKELTVEWLSEHL